MGNRYFRDDTFLLRLLRFFNLLEPDRSVVSISKSFMWVMVAATIYVLIRHPDNLVSLIAAISGIMVSTGNYAYRRYTQTKGQQETVDERDSSDVGRG